MNFKFNTHYGFTIIELIIVIVIIGIVTAVIAPRFFKLQTFEERGYYDEVMSAIRYAHKTAMATSCDYKVSVTSTGYEITKRSNCSNGVFQHFTNPATGSGNYTANTPSGLGVTGSLDFYYDNKGQPYNLAGIEITLISSIDIGSRTIKVEPYTGFVHN